MSLLDFVADVITYNHEPNNIGCECRVCRKIGRPWRWFGSRWTRFWMSLGEGLAAVLSPENLALGLSAIAGAFFYGALFTVPVYYLGTILGNNIPIFFAGAAWDWEAAWALSTACLLLFKDITFTVRDD